MSKLNKKIDIRQVIIAPVYSLKSKDYEYKGGMINRHVVHSYNNEFAAVIPMYNYGLREFYNLSNNFEKINAVSNEIKEDKRLVDIRIGKPLIDYLQSSKFAFNENRYISYKKLLYIIEPITKFEEYRHNEDRKKFVCGQKKCINKDVGFKKEIFRDCIIEKGKYYALYTQNGLPVSYEYINDEIPYVLKKEYNK